MSDSLYVSIRVVGVAHYILKQTITITIFKNEFYILLYFLKKYRIIKIKDNKLDFIYFLNNFINRKRVIKVI